MTDAFKNILTGSEVEQWVIDIIKKWAETYIDEVQFQIGWQGNQIPNPRSYTTRTRVRHFEDDQLPQCVVVSPGLADMPKREGDGTYRAEFSVGVSVICSAQDESSTKALARFYAAVTRAILVQHSSLDGHASGLEWRDESYDDIQDDADVSRVMAAGSNYFRIEVPEVVTWGSGPKFVKPPTPDTDPWPGESRWPPPPIAPDPQEQTVEAASVIIEREAI
jgi:hypothetical protein